MEIFQKKSFTRDIGKVRQAQYEALKAVTIQMINLYWEIGKSIFEKQSENWVTTIGVKFI